MIHLANSVIRGYLNYYSFVYNRNRLVGYVYYIIKDSLLRTIAAKKRLGTKAKVIKKYGKNITVNIYNAEGTKIIKTASLINVSKLYSMNV